MRGLTFNLGNYGSFEKYGLKSWIGLVVYIIKMNTLIVVSKGVKIH